ncbi:MAG: DEAD/DEAH box helicase [archaeon]
MADFLSLGLKKEIVDVLARMQFRKTTIVQDKVIPLALQGKNLVFTAMTGSGKTLAFTVGFLGKINRKLGTQMIVLVPTRELSVQVSKELKRLCEPLGINTGLFYGGKEMSLDKETLRRNNHIIIGTPGRLIVYINEKKVKIGDVKLIVYDESDQMFDNGFYSDCAYIKSRVSKNAQIILASATISEKVQEFIQNEIGNYELLKIGLQIPESILQEKIDCAIPAKPALLLKILNQKRFARVLIFCNRKTRVDEISEYLNNHAISARPINADLDQIDREENLSLFKQGKIAVLVATDVAARGLHIPSVDAVINYDVPTKAEFYVHRIGRTGRTGRPGYALTFICPEDDDRFHNIEFDYELKVGCMKGG